MQCQLTPKKNLLSHFSHDSRLQISFLRDFLECWCVWLWTFDLTFVLLIVFMDFVVFLVFNLYVVFTSCFILSPFPLCFFLTLTSLPVFVCLPAFADYSAIVVFNCVLLICVFPVSSSQHLISVSDSVAAFKHALNWIIKKELYMWKSWHRTKQGSD